MKCTVCTAYCPVLQVNPLYPGPKQAGPDGERLRLKDPYFFNYALKYCLNCKRCEVACPSGVDVADLIQSARIKYDKEKPNLRNRILASTDVMGTLARPFAPVVNTVTSLGITKTVMDWGLDIDRHRTFPKYSARGFESWLKRRRKEQAAFPEQVAYFHGCYVNYNYPQLGKDMVKILNALGVGVQLLDKESCCGIALITNGLTKQAVKNGQHNIDVIRKAVVDGGLKVLLRQIAKRFALRAAEALRVGVGLDERGIVDPLQKGRFAVALLADDGCAVAGIEHKIEVVQHGAQIAPVRDGQMLNLKHKEVLAFRAPNAAHRACSTRGKASVNVYFGKV